MSIELEWDARAAARGMADAAKQVPFASVLALNDVAVQARDHVRAQMGKHFTLRTRWTVSGVRVTTANKATRRVIIGSVDRFMELQATGGEKKPSPGQKRMGVPMGIRATPQQMTRPAQWPKRLLQKKRHFVLRNPARPEQVLVVKRMGKGPDADLKVLYSLRPVVTIPKRWPMRDEIEQVMRRGWPEAQVRALARALEKRR